MTPDVASQHLLLHVVEQERQQQCISCHISFTAQGERSDLNCRGKKSSQMDPPCGCSLSAGETVNPKRLGQEHNPGYWCSQLQSAPYLMSLKTMQVLEHKSAVTITWSCAVCCSWPAPMQMHKVDVLVEDSVRMQLSP